MSSLEAALADGEKALAAGDSARAFELLARVSQQGVGPADIHRFASAFALAGRFQDRHAEVLDWIERTIDQRGSDASQRASLLWARVAVCRQLDLKRVLDLAEEALEAADAAGDERAYASVLSNAAFAGYRRGDARAASDYAERAALRTFNTAAAHYEATRAQMFAATSLGDLEAALNHAIKARAMARELDRPGDVANESNNIAESYLELGYPLEARKCAQTAVEFARKSGHKPVEVFSCVMLAMAAAEAGDIDAALETFDQLGPLDANRIFAVDAASAQAYWLLERGAHGDATRARELAEKAVAGANHAGVRNRLTGLNANIARALAHEGKTEAARAALEEARKVADRGEPRAQQLLALAVAEVLPVSASKRKVALRNARARILRAASRREDPRAYCTRVRLHRRILELSGGVPDDLPAAD